MSQYGEIVENGLWKQNPGVVQLLGLCPTLAVTSTAINGLSLGIATSLVMALSNASVSPVRKLVPDEIRIPVFILIIAALVAVNALGDISDAETGRLLVGARSPSGTGWLADDIRR